MLLSLAYKLLFLTGGKLFIIVRVPQVDLSFVLALLEVGLVASDAIGRMVRGSCASFGVALELRGRVRTEYPGLCECFRLDHGYL